MRVGAKLQSPFNEFTIIKQLGQGGAGTVYKATSADGSLFAIKVLRSNLSATKRGRFKNEINFCQKDIHKGIIKVVDYGTHEIDGNSSPFYVMPLYETTYREFIDNENNAQKILDSFLMLLDAVEAAHLRSCVHRDLKPENILISLQPLILVVSDFGIAHFEEDDLLTPIETLHADRLANFQYAAPEQRVKGATVDYKADIYALGLILNEVYTKIVPHGVGFKRIASVNDSFSYLDEIVDKMIQNLPTQRYGSIADIKEDLIKKGKLAISFQEVNRLQGTVIKEDDVSKDPLVANPIKIIDVDHDGIRTMTCKLNQSVNHLWTEVFHNSGANSYTSRFAPGHVNFQRDILVASVEIDYGTQAKGFLDTWLENTNRIYKIRIQTENQLAAQRKREKLMKDAEIELKRQNFLKQIKT